jgi:N-methylhydantoinase A
MTYTIAVDSGGTFCDCVVFDERGRVTRAKAPSTPPDFEHGVMDAVREAARRLERPLREVLGETVFFAHGTTVATNALITRTGAKVALLTTKGHEDAMLIGRTSAKVAGLSEDEIINVARLRKPVPLVPRPRIFGIDERVDRAGRVVVPLHLERVRPLLDMLDAARVEAVAVSFLWSFLNPSHERMIEAWLRDNRPNLFVTASSELVPLIREYERTATTVLNAYLTPIVGRYLERMSAQLVGEGLSGAIAVMLSSGGLASVEEASRRGAALLVSGPAGGALGAQTLGRHLGLDRVLTTDVGGTSFDVGVIARGEAGYSDSPVVDKYPLALPVIDVASIGAGGGSIAWVERETGVLRVGPDSAGARPGPACYGRGGVEPTVTDANLALGRLNPDYFLAGRLRLDPDKARQAIRRRVAEPLGMRVEEAAAAIIEIVDSQMADLIRKVTVERGEDPAGFTVLAYGGAGGLHCDAYASALGCRGVVIPFAAAVFSALGIAGSDAKRVVQLSDPVRAPFDLARWRTHFDRLCRLVMESMRSQRLPIGEVRLARFVHLLFRGQVHTLRVPIEPADLDAPNAGRAIVERFKDMYEARFGEGTAYVKAGVEATALSVEAVASLAKPVFAKVPLGPADASTALKGHRPVFLHDRGGFAEVAIYAGNLLEPGHVVEGPALVEAEDTTVLVGSGHRLAVDGYQNLHIDLRTARKPLARKVEAVEVT